MNNSLQQFSVENISQLLYKTFQGSSTEQVQRAILDLNSLSQKSYQKFLNASEEILIEASTKNSNLFNATVNYFKFMTRTFIDRKRIFKHGSRDYLTKIEHCFDNNRVRDELKSELSLLVMQLDEFFHENPRQLLLKTKYMLQTDELTKGLFHCRSYIRIHHLSCKNMKFYFEAIVPTLISKIQEKSEILSHQKGLNYSTSESLTFEISSKEILDTVECLDMSLPEDFLDRNDAVALQTFGEQKTASTFRDLLNVVKNQQKQHKTVVFSIVRKILANFSRAGRISQISSLKDVLLQMVNELWEAFIRQSIVNQQLRSSGITPLESKTFEQGDREQLNELLSLFTMCFKQTLLFYIPKDDQEVFQFLIQPLYQLVIERLKQAQRTTLLQLVQELNDACFRMSSETTLVCYNRLVNTLLKENSEASQTVKKIIRNGLFRQQNSCDKKTNPLLNLLILQIRHFMVDLTFLVELKNYGIDNIVQLLGSQSTVRTFTLLFYKSYMDDIFFEENTYFLLSHIIELHCGLIEKRAVNPALQNHWEGIIIFFEELIIKEQLKQRFESKGIFESVNKLMSLFKQQFDYQYIDLAVSVIQNYPIEDKEILQVLDAMLADFSKCQSFESNQMRLDLEKKLFEFLSVFFGINAFETLFEYTLSRFQPIFSGCVQKCQNSCRQRILDILRKVVARLGYLPRNYSNVFIEVVQPQEFLTDHSSTVYENLASIVQSFKANNLSSKEEYLNYAGLINFIGVKLTMAVNLVHHLLTEKGQQKLFQSFEKLSIGAIQDGSNLKLEPTVSSLTENFDSLLVQSKALMVLHQTIFYHIRAFTEKSLRFMIESIFKVIASKRKNASKGDSNEKRPNFTLGKLQLVFLALISVDCQRVNRILAELGITEDVYSQVYQLDHNYLIQYDIGVFIDRQCHIFMNSLHESPVLDYANVAFLSMVYCLNRIESETAQKIVNQRESREEQQFFEDTIDSSKEFKSAFYQLQNYAFFTKYIEFNQILEKIPLPNQWTRHRGKTIDKFKAMVQIFESDQKSKQWLSILTEKGIDDSTKKFLKQIVELKNVNGKCRKIHTIIGQKKISEI